MSIDEKETKERLKALRELAGYSNFDRAIKSLNRERLTNNNRQKRVHFPWSKYGMLYKQSGGQCWWCGELMPFIKGRVEIDHFNPNADDFNNNDNLGLLHTECNREKGSMDLDTQAKVLGITLTRLIERRNA